MATPWRYNTDETYELAAHCECGGGAGLLVTFDHQGEPTVTRAVTPCEDCGALIPAAAVEAALEAAAAASQGAYEWEEEYMRALYETERADRWAGIRF